MPSLAELLKRGKKVTPFEQAHFLARLNASLPREVGGLGLPIENTAMQRADILFPDEMYHGTGQESIEFLSPEGKNRTSGAGAFLTTSPINAETYVPGLGQSGNILPLRVNRQGLMEVNARGRNWNDINTNDLFHRRKALVDMFPEDLSPNDVTTTDEIAQLAPYGGFEGVTIKNVKDQGPNSHVFRVKEYLQNKYGIEPSEAHTYWEGVTGRQLKEARDYVEKMYSSQKGDVTAIQNPARIRSKFAAFDPMRRNEANLLASHPIANAIGLTGLGKLLSAGQDVDLRGSINDYLSEGYDPAGLEKLTGVAPTVKRGDIAKEALGMTDIYAPMAAAEAYDAAMKGDWKGAGLSALGAMPLVGGMIKASHGSPHMFDKFDFSKIGTGEGAQAYGHGGYFAQGFDSPVANEYQKQLAEDVFDVAGNVFDPASLEHLNVRSIARRGDLEGAINKAKEIALSDSPVADMAKSDLSTLLDIQNKGGLSPAQGHLYNVELRWPDAEREAADPLGMKHFLDWYQPFSQQPENVKDAVIKALHNDAYKASQKEVKAFNPESEPSWMTDLFSGDTPKFNPSDYYDLYRSRTGEQIYKTLAERLGGEKEASALLRESGLPGLRYQDEKSRYLPFGEGTHNFVMFDDQFPNIVSRNGVSLSDLLRR